ncbi:MAG: hypothetical protein NTV86_23745, partial [Planctomycetota bacterium]|nr:hypothetical protein [Planctomycetota bacterium]
DGTAAGSTAAGGSIALAFVTPTTHAYIEGSVSTPVTHPTSIDVTATSQTDVATTAKSTTQGSSQNDAGTQGQLGSVDAKSSQGESGVSVAGAFALTDLTANNLAHAASSGTIVTGGTLHVHAYNDTDSSATADASFTGEDAPATGVGVAVAANVPTIHNEAHLSGPVTGNGIEVDAQMNAADVDGKNTLAAKSTSGASGSSVGAAGSFAMNLVDSNASASLQSGGTINASGGNVLVQSDNVSDESAEAAAKASGGTSVGVGASVALNIALNNVSEARVEDGTAMSNLNNLTLTAGSDHTVATTTDAGSTGGTSVTPSVAVTYTDNETTASLGTGALLTVAGALTATATGKSSVSSEAKADAEADKVAVGASIGVTVANDTATATTG